MTIRGHILVVDNDAENVDALSMLLTEWGYKAFTASSADQALAVLHEQHIDLAIIDVRLNDENDTTDRTGIRLAEEIDDATVKILITAHRKFELRKKWLRRTDVYLKDDPPRQLQEKIELLFAKYVRYNHNLKIKWAARLTGEALKTPLHKVAQADEIIQDAAFMEKFQHMLRKLFFQETRIELKPLDAGRSGAGVIMVRPFYEKAQGAPVVVKYGYKDDIVTEYERYSRFVEPFLVMHTTHLIGKPERSHYLSGMKLMFVGADHQRNIRVYDFARAFQSPRLFDNKGLEDCIRHLFKETCDLWYSGKRKWRKRGLDAASGFDDMPTSYEKQLKLNAPAKSACVKQVIDGLHGQRIQDIAIHVEDEIVRFEFAGDSAETHPNPWHFWQHQRHLIPLKPKFVCITHGDLQARNLLVDESEHTWLIDFQRTEWGPGLRDAAELESAIKFDLLDSTDLPALLKFEQSVLDCLNLNQRITFHELPKMRLSRQRIFERAALTIDAVRYEASSALEHPPFEEYLVGLFFYAIKMLSFDDVTTGFSAEMKQSRKEAARIHMLYSAARICSLLSEHHKQSR